ncbi:MAG: DUF4367 domain-containing protein [Clostridia bacterium]|nr:DUF4367 domain-containing protein [Clostridia bacterium]
MTCSSEERIDLLLELLVEGCGDDELELYNSIDTTNVTFSKRFERNKEKILSKGKLEPFAVQFKRVLSRVAIICLVVLSLSFATMMSVSAVRQAVWNTIVEIFNEYFEISHENSDDTTGEAITEIQIVHKPATLPEGVEEEILINGKRMFLADYYKGDEHLGMFRQTILDETSSVHVNSEMVTISSYEINKNHITIIDYNNGTVSMFWSDDYYFYTIDGYDIDTLKDLISRIE